MKRSPHRGGPGLAKAGPHRLVATRPVELFRSNDYGWRELFEKADVMSEGAVKDELEGATYYGTTSVLLPFVSHGGHVPDEHAKDVVRLITCDPHARLRAVRIAWREASVRAVAPLGRVETELVVRPDSRGIRMDVDVEARVLATVRARPGARSR